MQDLQNKYKQNPRQSLVQKAQGYAQDNWVVVSLIVAILAVTFYIVVSQKTSLPYNPSDSSKTPEYWLDRFSRIGGHFSNFSTVVSEELDRNFNKINQDLFKLEVSGEILDKNNWKTLFNQTEQVVKGMKLISLQEEVLREKYENFNKTQTSFEDCKRILLKSDLVMESDSHELVNANRTIVKAEGVLESLRDTLTSLQNRRKNEINITNIQINHKLSEKKLQQQMIVQSADDSQYMKNLEGVLEAIQEKIRVHKLEIENLLAQQKESEQINQNLEQNISQLKDDISQIEFDIATLLLNLEIDEIVGRVKREDNINNTKQLISSIQKRIKLYNNHKISGSSYTQEMEKTLESDKAQLKNLNTLQINLIKNFHKQFVSPGGKTLDQLRHEEKIKKSLIENLTKRFDNKDKTAKDFDLEIERIEKMIQGLQEDENKAKENIENATKNTGPNQQVNTEEIKDKIKKIDEEINLLKEIRNKQEVEFQKEIDNQIRVITKQKEEVHSIQTSFTRQIRERQQKEESILTELNRCRQHRYMMETIQLSANSTQHNVAITQENLKKIKASMIELLDLMIPEEDVLNEIQIQE